MKTVAEIYSRLEGVKTTLAGSVKKKCIQKDLERNLANKVRQSVNYVLGKGEEHCYVYLCIPPHLNICTLNTIFQRFLISYAVLLVSIKKGS